MHGGRLKTYRDICISDQFVTLTSGELLPQDELNSLMTNHFATFITDYDLELLKSAHIDTLRIPVTYNMFLPKQNRTGNFPKGELKALNM